MIAFVFPGQGSQVVGMGRALAAADPISRATFEAADEALGEDLSRLCFEGPAAELSLTEYTQPALLAVSTAAARFLGRRGLRPAFVAGHSLGEYSAHVAAGTIAFEDAVRLVRLRGRYMQEAVPIGAGAMAAVLGLDRASTESAVAEAARETGQVVSAANINGPRQIVIAGTREGVEAASARAKALGARRVVPLDVSAPFHCALMAPAEARLAPALQSLHTLDPSVPVIANVDASPVQDRARAIDALIGQVSRPVLWQQTVEWLANQGVRHYVEVGPGHVLSGLVRKIDRHAEVATFAEPKDLPAVEALFSAVAQ